MAEKKKISIVIPCYRSENTIETVVEKCIEMLSQRENHFEIVLVNDCSPDNTWSKIVGLNKKHRNTVIGVNFTKNFGQHAALMAGFRETEGDIVVTMDDDGQTDPSDLWKLIDRLDDGYDVVIARYPILKETWFRRFGSYVNKVMSETLLGKPKNIRGSSYIAFRKYIIDEIIKYDKSFPYLGGLIFRSTRNIGEVEIEHHDRLLGESGYSMKKLVGLILNGFTAFSVIPLRVASFTGIIFASGGFLFGIITIIRKLIYPEIQVGYSSIMAVILFIGGVIMMMLGLIGEYIGRIYISINNSPQYVVKEKIR